MKSGVKTAVSLLITVVVFVGFTLLGSLGMFSSIEKSFYEPAKVNSVRKNLDDAAVCGDEYIHSLIKATGPYNGGFMSETDVNTFVSQMPSSQILKEWYSFQEKYPELEGIRVIDSKGRRIHYSSFKNDSKLNGQKRVFSYYQDAKTLSGTSEIDYSFINACLDESGEIENKETENKESENREQVQVEDDDVAAETISENPYKKGRITFDSENQRLIISYPLENEENTFTFAFYFNLQGLKNLLIQKSIVSIDEPFLLLSSGDFSEGGLAFNVSKINAKILSPKIVDLWKRKITGPEQIFIRSLNEETKVQTEKTESEEENQEQPQIQDNSIKKSIEDPDYLFISDSKNLLIHVSGLYDTGLLTLPDYVRILLLICAFITICLFVLILICFKKDDEVVIKNKIKRFQLELLNEYLSENISRAQIAGKVQANQDELSKKIKDELGRRGKKHSREVDAMLEQSWNDIILALSGKGFGNETASIDMNAIKSMFQEVISSGTIKVRSENIETVSSPVVVEAKAAPSKKEVPVAKPEPVEELEDAEPVEEAEAVEELEDAEPVEEAEAVEELEDAEPVEEAEAVEELEDAEPVEEAEAVEELEDAEPVEEAEAVEELEDAEPIEEAEAVEELEDAEPVEEAEAVEELEDAEPVEEAEAVEELEDAEPVEEAEAVEELEDAEPVEEAEAVEELEDAEPVENPEGDNHSDEGVRISPSELRDMYVGTEPLEFSLPANKYDEEPSQFADPEIDDFTIASPVSDMFMETSFGNNNDNLSEDGSEEGSEDLSFSEPVSEKENDAPAVEVNVVSPEAEIAEGFKDDDAETLPETEPVAESKSSAESQDAAESETAAAAEPLSESLEAAESQEIIADEEPAMGMEFSEEAAPSEESQLSAESQEIIEKEVSESAEPVEEGAEACADADAITESQPVEDVEQAIENEENIEESEIKVDEEMSENAETEITESNGIDDVSDAEPVSQPQNKLGRSSQFMFTSFGANNNNITDLPPDMIVEDKDGVFSISNDSNPVLPPMDLSFKELVDSVLH